MTVPLHDATTAIGGGEGAQWRAPLGRAVIGGVITSTMLTLLVIPTFYDILAGMREWFGRRLRRPRHHGARLREEDRGPAVLRHL